MSAEFYQNLLLFQALNHFPHITVAVTVNYSSLANAKLL